MEIGHRFRYISVRGESNRNTFQSCPGFCSITIYRKAVLFSVPITWHLMWAAFWLRLSLTYSEFLKLRFDWNLYSSACLRFLQLSSQLSIFNNIISSMSLAQNTVAILGCREELRNEQTLSSFHSPSITAASTFLYLSCHPVIRLLVISYLDDYTCLLLISHPSISVFQSRVHPTHCQNNTAQSSI